ncbi:MAG: SPOR domain-containing protein [Porphyrobacter sp.]|jgi:TPR repeat protein|nr:SPOR domain-containing protein [Porphyrobacter sp.]
MVHRLKIAEFARSGLLAGAAGLALLAAPALADVKAGVDAWEAGDYARAIAEWQGPAKAGDPDALFNLAQAYRLGRGVEPNSARAREYYAAASAKGHLKAADNYGLLLFQEGEQDKAMPLVKAAAERGDPRAQYVVGLAHFNGDYAPRDWVRAYALMTLANGAGLPQAAGALTQMDKYIPIAQRQQAQSMARQMDEDAASQRAAALAAADLGVRPAAASPAPAARTPAAVAPAPRAVAVTSPKPPAAAAVSAPVSAPAPVVARVVTPAPQLAVQTAASAPAPAATPAPRAVSAASSDGKWRVQLGAFGVAGNADKLWNQLAGNPALAGTRKALVPGGKVTRLHAVGFASKSAAEQACSTLQRQGHSCLVAGNS